MLRPITISHEEAKARGFWALTTAYILPSERWMLQRALSDFERGSVRAVLVGSPEAPEIWRDGQMLTSQLVQTDDRRQPA